MARVPTARRPPFIREFFDARRDFRRRARR
jgi:hypothetical protein